MQKKQVRIVALSDTHGTHRSVAVPKADILIYAGDADICNKESFDDFMDWYGSQDATYKLFVAGNHDVWLDENYDGRFKAHSKPFNHKYIAEKLKFNGVVWLNESGITICGVHFYGSAMTPEFCGWAFMAHRDEIHEYWNKIPIDTQVLITHGPAFGINDNVPSYKQEGCGCKALLDKLHHLPKLKYHVHGHLHTGNCRNSIGHWTPLNVSIVNEDYSIDNCPKTFWM